VTILAFVAAGLVLMFVVAAVVSILFDEPDWP
jgi:hypothetical protein